MVSAPSLCAFLVLASAPEASPEHMFLPRWKGAKVSRGLVDEPNRASKSKEALVGIGMQTHLGLAELKDT